SIPLTALKQPSAPSPGFASAPLTSPHISVILPVYNEEGLVNATFREVGRFADGHPGYEFIVADDGSTDGTYAILEQLVAARTGRGIRVARYSLNRGKGYALRRALSHAQGELVCFTDGDLAYSLD